MLYTVTAFACIILFVIFGLKASSPLLQWSCWLLAGLGGAFWFATTMGLVSGAKTTPYQVLEQAGHLELRQYPNLPLVVTEVESSQLQAMHQGFSPLATYIFGANEQQTKIAMTTPVLQFAIDANFDQITKRKVAFVLPLEDSVNEYPQPNNNEVKLETLSKARYWVYTWRGSLEAHQFQTAMASIQAVCQSKGYQCASQAIHAAYSPPWVFSWRRVHELWVPVLS